MNFATSEPRIDNTKMHRTSSRDPIVIAGGGSIGLSTAYNLAKSRIQSNKEVRIHVIEIGDSPFAATSESCTGCFHYHFEGSQLKPLRSLGEYSFDQWAACAGAESDFLATTGYQVQSSFGVDLGSGQGLEKLPDWVRRHRDWDVDPGVLGARTATV